MLGERVRRGWLNMESTSEAPLHVVGMSTPGRCMCHRGGVRRTCWYGRGRPRAAEGPTWGCGYVRPTARMQYTGRSFAEMIGQTIAAPLPPAAHDEQASPRAVSFPGEFASRCPDPVSEKVYEPFFRRWAERFSRLRILQQGKVHVYLVYIVLDGRAGPGLGVSCARGGGVS